MVKPKVSAVIPTLGRSPWLRRCLDALRRDGGGEIEILVVAQGDEVDPQALALADRVLRLPVNIGFARANNLAFAAAQGDLLATVNDDALVDEGWLAALAGALADRPDVAAVQGVQLSHDDPGRIDGAGLAWNRFWQAVQIGRGEPATEIGGPPAEVFGVSATAALYRREALAAVGGTRLEVFDERLFAYYEDVDLAGRLRAAGHRALTVPDARARHVGSVTGHRLGRLRRRLIYGNRHLVLARLLGTAFWTRWPRILLRDLADLRNALRRRDLNAAAGIANGAGRALRRLPGFVRRGEPLVPLAELRRFQRD